MTDMTELIPWAIKRIVNGECEITLDKKDQIISMEIDPAHGKLSLEEMEDFLKRELSPEHQYLLFSLKESCSKDDMKFVLKELFPPWGLEIAENCKGGDWEGLISQLLREFKSYAESVGIALTKEREGLGSKRAARIEDLITAERQEASSYYLKIKFAREFAELFPKAIDRAEKMSILSTKGNAPKNIKAYLTEASRCYIFGQSLAALILCRSAIESSCEWCLTNRGFGKEVKEIRNDKLVNLLKMARREDLLNSIHYTIADRIRDITNEAIHNERIHSFEECEEIFYMTRGIIKHLFE